MSITDIKDVLETSSFRIALLVFFSSLVFLLPDSVVSSLFSAVVFLLPGSVASWVLVFRPGFEHYHTATQNTYGIQIFIAFIVSSVLILSHSFIIAKEKLENRKGRLIIKKATYRCDEFNTFNVIARVKKRKKKQEGEDYLKFQADDNVLLAIGKKDDPCSGSRKTFWVEYWYKHIENYEQGEWVEISEERWQRERDRSKMLAT